MGFTCDSLIEVLKIGGYGLGSLTVTYKGLTPGAESDYGLRKGVADMFDDELFETYLRAFKVFVGETYSDEKCDEFKRELIRRAGDGLKLGEFLSSILNEEIFVETAWDEMDDDSDDSSENDEY